MCVRFLFSKFGVLILFLILEHVLILLLFVHNNSVTIKPDVIKHYKRLLEKLYYDDKEPPTVYQSRVNSTWLSNHPVYGKFYIRERKVKRIVDILVIVSSAPRRIERRNAIRATWFTQCVTTKKIVPACIFMTEQLAPRHQYYNTIRQERATFKDLHLQIHTDNETPGQQFINHLIYALQNYQFDYLLRQDDSSMLCLSKVLAELPMPKLSNFHWGTINHEEIAGKRKPDRYTILLSRDLIETFLLQDLSTMLCHPLEDHMIAIWLAELKLSNVYRHDFRIIRYSGLGGGHSHSNLCHSHIAIQWTRPPEMRSLWVLRGNHKDTEGDLKTNAIRIPTDYSFDWMLFDEKLSFEPKLCNSNPTWNLRKILGGDASQPVTDYII